MNPGSVQTLYRLRRWGQVALLVTPLIVLGGAYLLVTQVLMVPRQPDARTPAGDVLRFIVHEKGLPRLSRPQYEAFLSTQLARLASDPTFHERFFAEVRTASPVEQQAFRNHLFDAFLPIVRADTERYAALDESARPAFLDERLTAYEAFNQLHVNKSDLGSAALGPEEALKFITEKASARDMKLGVAYFAAMQARAAQKLADPDRKPESGPAKASAGVPPPAR